MPKVELTCPLGSKCEEIKDGKILRCAWYQEVFVNNESDHWECAIAFSNTLQSEMKNRIVGLQHSIESFRNVTDERQQQFNNILSQAAKLKLVKR